MKSVIIFYIDNYQLYCGIQCKKLMNIIVDKRKCVEKLE